MSVLVSFECDEVICFVAEENYYLSTYRM